MKRTLSSQSLKRLFLPRLVGGSLGVGVALLLLVRMQSSVGIPRELVVAVAGAVVLIWSTLVVKDCLTWRSLRRVALDEHFLYVSAYDDSEEIVVPLTDIVRITQLRGRTLRTVTVHLRSRSKYGDRIRFQPHIEEWGWALTEDKIVQELRMLANLQAD
jgi:hypothetical protein